MAARFFGQFLLERGRINRKQLLDAFQLWTSLRVNLGELAMLRGLMTAEQVASVKSKVRTGDTTFEKTVVQEGILSHGQLATLRAHQREDRLMLGEALVQKGHLTKEVLDQELTAFEKHRARVPTAIASLYLRKPNADALELFADSIRKLFLLVIYETRLRIGPCHEDPSAAQSHEFTVTQEFRGAFEGVFALGLDTNLLCRIAGSMLDEDVHEINDIAMDGVVEFVNVIGGNVCAALSGLGWTAEISPPTVHDNRSGTPLDLASTFPSANTTITPIQLPKDQVEFWVIDQRARITRLA